MVNKRCDNISGKGERILFLMFVYQLTQSRMRVEKTFYGL